jgi:hypothetical protein
VVTGLSPVQVRMVEGRPHSPVQPATAIDRLNDELQTGLPSLPDQRSAASIRQQITIQAVKAYKIQRIKSGMKFTCTHCAHSVSTLDFDAKVGNLRTQAATAINLHATQAHHEPMVVSPSDGQQRSWR